MSSGVVDLDQMVIQWAWQVFKVTKEKTMKNLKFEDVTFEINWQSLRIRSLTPVYSQKNLKENCSRNLVFKALYENRTSTSQDNHFTTTRSTICKCVTTVTEGFKKGWSLGVQLAVPYEVLQATASYGREVTIENTDGSEVEEAISWTVDSTINIQPNTRVIVRLEVTEHQFTAVFNMQVCISGHAVVSVLSKTENNSLLQIVEGEISEIIKGRLPELHSAKIAPDGKTVHWRLVGTCDFIYGVQQHVLVDEEELTD